MRKILSMLLALAMVFSCMSTVAFAEDTAVAKVGNTGYATIDEAIAAWTNKTTLTLLADVTLSDVITLKSTEYHILDLGIYTMTAASKKDAIQIENNARSSASYALDIKADATNPGGITATGKAIVRTAGKSGVKDRPIIRFYGGVFNASYIVYHSGSNGTNCPQFQFHGGEFNGTIYTNRALNQFYGGNFNGSLMMSVDSSAYTLVAGGTFKQLSNLYMSALNSDKFTIGSAKGKFDKEVYVDDNGNYVIAAAEPTEGIEAAVAKTPGTNDYLKYSKVATEGNLNYTDVYVALNNNTSTSAKVTVYTDELDLTGSKFEGTIVVPEGETLTVTNAPESLTVIDTAGNELVKGDDGTYAPAPVWEGEGTEEVPYLIEDVDGLIAFQTSVNSGKVNDKAYFKLTKDINLADTSAIQLLSDEVTSNWTPIGTSENPFTGTFDGDGKTISNLIVVGGANQGFIGYANKATIKNINIENATVIGTDCVGAIAGQVYSSSLIDNCHVSGNIQITGQTNVGGIVGKYYTKVTNSSVIGDGTDKSFVKGVYQASDFEGDNVGGIMGHGGENNNFVGNTVKNITISGTRKIGGIVGTTDRATDVSGCVVENVILETTATVDYATNKADTMALGGLIGHYYGNSTGGTVNDSTVEDISFVKEYDVSIHAGAIVGNNRTTPNDPVEGVTTSNITVTDVTGATNNYLQPTITYVAEVNGVGYETVTEALKAAAETGASEVKILQSVRELLEDDLFVTIKSDLTITADSAVTVEFYNNGTTYDLILDGTNGEKLTIAENVTLTVSAPRIIWIGYSGNNIDVFVDGALIGGYQLWFGGDVTVSETGTVGSKGEALVARRGAKLTVNGGTLDANYFSLISGTVELNNATATTGPLWLSSNTEGAGEIILNNSSLTSKGNLKLSGGASVTVTGGSELNITDEYRYGASVISEDCSLTIDTSSSVTSNAITGAGNVNIDASKFDGTEVSVLDTAGMSGFTGNVSVVNNSGADYEISDDGTIKIIEKTAVYVATVNGVGYETLLGAFAEAVSGDTVELLGDLTLAAGDIDSYHNIKIPAGVTFDGKGYTLTVEEHQDSDWGTIWSDGAYTIQNITVKVMGERQNGRTIINVSKGGVVKNVNLWSEVLDLGIVYGKPTDGMTLLVEDCEIYTASDAFYADPTDAKIDVTIRNNIIKANKFGSMQFDEYIVGNTLTETCTKGMSLGRTFTGTVTGNTFNGARALSVYATQNISGNIISENSCVEINDGAIANLSGNYWGGNAPSESQIVLDGETGTYTVENYYADAELTQLVTLGGNYVAEVNGVGYETLEEALAAAEDGDTITLLSDIELSGTIGTTKSITLDGNDHKITPAADFVANGNSAALVFANGKTEYNSSINCAVKNVTFEGFSGLCRVVRANFCNATIENCVFKNNNVSGDSSGVITSAYAKLDVKDCEFNGNTSEFAVINIGYDVSNGTELIANLTGNAFAENEAAFAVIYLASSANVTDNYFSENIHTGDNANAAAILAGPYSGSTSYTVNITKNAFENAMIKGEIALPAVYTEDWKKGTAFDLSSNYWNGAEPVKGVAYKSNEGDPDVTIDNYYASYENGELADLVEIATAVAKIGDDEYETLEAAIDAAKDGDEIVVLSEITISEETVINKSVTISGEVVNANSMLTIANGVTLISENLKGNYYAEADATVTVNTPNAYFIAGGNLTFVGENIVSGFSAGYSNRVITIQAGNSLKVTSSRLTVSYGNIFNIKGDIENAKETNKENITPSLELVGGISFTGNGNYGDGTAVSFNVENAYVKLGDSTTKNTDATGTFNVNFTNSIVDFTKTLKTYEPTVTGKTPTVNLNWKNSVVSTASHLELWRTATNMTLDNTDLTVGGSFANAGTIDVINGTNFVVKAPIMSSHGGNTGTITIDGAVMELKDSNQDWENNGTFKVTADGKLITNDFASNGSIIIDAMELAAGTSATVIENANGTSTSLEGKVTIENGENVTVTYGDKGSVTIEKEEAVAVAKIGETEYATLQEAIAEAKDGDTIVLLENIDVDTESYTIKDGVSLTLDMNGKKITVTDNATGNYELFYNFGELTVTGNGTIELTATQNREWNASSSIFHNRGGAMTIENGTYTHKGGTNMAFVVDDSGNSYGDAYLTVNGGALTSSYIGVRMRMADTTLNGNPGNGVVYMTVTGGTIEGTKRGIWGQITNAYSGELGALEITGGTIKGDTAIQMTADEYKNIDVSISGDANIVGGIAGDVTDIVITDGTFTTDVSAYVAEGYEVKANDDGTYGVVEKETITEHFTLAGTNTSLESSLAFNFYLTKTKYATGGDYVAVFEQEKENEVITTEVPYSEWVLTENGLRVVYSGMAAKEMVDNVKLTVYDAEGNQVSDTFETSMKEYATGMIDYIIAEDLQSLKLWLPALADMLNFGAGAQELLGYKVDNLANAVADKYTSLASTTYNITNEGCDLPAELVAGTNVTLEDKTKLNIYFIPTAGVAKAKYSYTTHGGTYIENEVSADSFKALGKYLGLSIEEIAIADTDKLVTITMYDKNDAELGTATYSVDAHLLDCINANLPDAVYPAFAKFSASARKAFAK